MPGMRSSAQEGRCAIKIFGGPSMEGPKALSDAKVPSAVGVWSIEI